MTYERVPSKNPLLCFRQKEHPKTSSSVQTLYDPCVRWLNPPSVHSTAKSPTSDSTRSQKVLSEVHTYDRIGGDIALLLDHWQQRWAWDTATVTPHQSHRLIHLQKHYVNHSLSEAVFFALEWHLPFPDCETFHSLTFTFPRPPSLKSPVGSLTRERLRFQAWELSPLTGEVGGSKWEPPRTVGLKNAKPKRCPPPSAVPTPTSACPLPHHHASWDSGTSENETEWGDQKRACGSF